MKNFKYPLNVVAMAFGFILLGVVMLWAQDITFEATVDTSTVELGASLQLTLTFTGADALPPVDTPKVDGLEIRYLGPSTQVTVINGQMSRTASMVYTVIPVKLGHFRIPSVTVNIKGKDYTSNPIDIEVVNAGALNQPSATGSNNSVGGLQDKIFIVMGTPKKEAYLNESIPLVIKLFVNQLQVKNVQYPAFNHDGFTADEFHGQPPQYVQTLGGVAYQVLEFKTFIYPTRTGDLTIGPAKLNANIMIKSSRKRADPFGSMGSLFDDDALDSFFGAYDMKTISVESADLRLSVLPFPDANKPENFSGAVGKYDFKMTVSPATVKVGDPVTIKMKVLGVGNLKAINMPILKESPDFKIYDPKISDQEDGKVLEQVIIPKHDKVNQVPAVDFSYFDDKDKKYVTVSKGPFSLMVLPLEKGEEPKVVGLSATATSANNLTPAEELGRDIRYIKEDLGAVQKKGDTLLKNTGYLLSVCASIMIWLGLFLNYLIREKLKTDVRFARRLQAPYQARQGLAQAKRYLQQQDPRHFYDLLFKVLQDYFANKFHLPPGSITVYKISEIVTLQGRGRDVLDKVENLFAECELVRYASGGTDMTKMSEALQRTEEIIDFFERSFK